MCRHSKTLFIRIKYHSISLHIGSRLPILRRIVPLLLVCLMTFSKLIQAEGVMMPEEHLHVVPALLIKRLNDAGVIFNKFVGIEGGYYLDVQRTKISELSPIVSALFSSDVESVPKWRVTFNDTNTPKLALNICNTEVTDLSPLRGLPISLLWLANTSVTNLSPLRGMPINSLHIAQSRISDLSSLDGMPLEEIYLTPSIIVSGWDVLRHIPSLKRINQSSSKEFFDRYDKGLWGKAETPGVSPKK
jgi:hypothetical protein